MLDPDDNRNIVKVVLYVLLGLLSGILGVLSRAVDEEERITLREVVIKGLSAGMAGFIVFMFCSYLEQGWAMTGVAVGVAGWLGADATMQLLSTKIRKYIGIEKEKRNDHP